MSTIEKGGRLFTDFHPHYRGRGARRSIKGLATILARAKINGYAPCAYRELSPYVIKTAQEEGDKVELFALPASEVEVINEDGSITHLKLMPHPHSNLAQFNRDVKAYDTNPQSPLKVTERMSKEYHAAVEIVHPNPRGKYARWIAGMMVPLAREFILEVNDRGWDTPLSIELFSGERDKLLGQKNASGIAEVAQLHAELREKGIKIGLTSGSDDHGHSAGEYRTSWIADRLIKSSIDMFESYTTTLRENPDSVQPEFIGVLPTGLHSKLVILDIGITHTLPRLEERVVRFDRILRSKLPWSKGNTPVDLSRPKTCESLKLYLWMTGRSSSEERSWLKRFESASNDFSDYPYLFNALGIQLEDVQPAFLQSTYPQLVGSVLGN